MAIYSLHHASIGKTTQTRRYTASAHIRYITRKAACTRLMSARMPGRGGAARAWLRREEDADRKNARVGDKILLALPIELDPDQRAQLIEAFAEEITRGRASWMAAVHDAKADRHNPHCHLFIRDRCAETGERVCMMSERGSTERLRLLWERHANRALKQAGRSERVDRRTLKAQGIERTPTIHEGLSARDMQAKGQRVRSKAINVRNRPGARSQSRVVDYRKFDKGRSRPAYNRQVRETASDYWAAIDVANIVRDWEREDAGLVDGVIRTGSARAKMPDVRIVDIEEGGDALARSQVASNRRLAVKLGQPPSERVVRSQSQNVRTGQTDETLREGLRDQSVKPPKERLPDILVDPLRPHPNSFAQPVPFSRNVHMNDAGLLETLKRTRNDSQAEWKLACAAFDNAVKQAFHEPDKAFTKMQDIRVRKGETAMIEKLRSDPDHFGRSPGSMLTISGYKAGGAGSRADAADARAQLASLYEAVRQTATKLKTAERALGNAGGLAKGQPKEKSRADDFAKQASLERDDELDRGDR